MDYHSPVVSKHRRAMRINLLVQGGPLATSAPNTARHFAQAALDAGHAIGRVFFYKDAVVVGNGFAGDDGGLREAWRELAERGGFELAVCVAAAERRGLVEGKSLAEGFVIVGLGQLIDAMENGDRLVTF